MYIQIYSNTVHTVYSIIATYFKKELLLNIHPRIAPQFTGFEADQMLLN
jgi:folate-dependent phosphoribosylglycinamide formyltransferase PurN